jgi:hypothetical protein
MRTLPAVCTRYSAGMPASRSIAPQVALAMIISSATRVSSGEPRSRCSMLTKPLPGSARDAAVGGPVDAEVVVLAVAVVRGFAAPGFEHLGEFPEQLQLVA